MKQPLYIVTGAMGHVGNLTVKKLAQQGRLVRGLALKTDYSVHFDSDNVTIMRGDICDIQSLERLFQDSTSYDITVIHAAGIVSIATKYDQKVYDVNVNGTKNIIKLCLKYHVKKLVYISSVHAIPEGKDNRLIQEITHFDPNQVKGLYAKTKAEATQLVLDSVKRGLDASVVHPSGIIGIGDYGKGHLTQLIIDYLNGGLRAGVNGKYDFVDVLDVVDGILSCAEMGKPGECYILSNQIFTVKELLDILYEVTGRRKIHHILPLWFAKMTAPLSEQYYKMRKQPPLYTAYSLYTLGSNCNFSHNKATAILKYRPRDMRETLQNTVDWLIENKRVTLPKKVEQKEQQP